MTLLHFVESVYLLLSMSKLTAISLVIWSQLLTATKYMER